MNNNVVQILSLLFQRMVEEGNILHGEGELVEYLLEEGYPLADIDTALQLLFNRVSPDSVIDLTHLAGIQLYPGRLRILDREEKEFLNKEAQGVLEKLLNLELLDLQQWEHLFVVLQASYDGPVDREVLWQGLEQTLDESGLIAIIHLLPEYAHHAEHYKYYVN